MWKIKGKKIIEFNWRFIFGLILYYFYMNLTSCLLDISSRIDREKTALEEMNYSILICYKTRYLHNERANALCTRVRPMWLTSTRLVLDELLGTLG